MSAPVPCACGCGVPLTRRQLWPSKRQRFASNACRLAWLTAHHRTPEFRAKAATWGALARRPRRPPPPPETIAQRCPTCHARYTAPLGAPCPRCPPIAVTSAA